jgi:hypothetical protein
MSNLSDKDLDRLSREAADSYEPDSSSLSWSKLEQKLTQQMPERPPDGIRFGRINPFIWGSAVILVSGITFYITKNFTHSKDSTRTIQSVNKAVSADSINKMNDGTTVILDSISSAPDLAEMEKNNTDKGKQTEPAVDGKSNPQALSGGILNESNKAESSSSRNKNGLSADAKNRSDAAGGNTSGNDSKIIPGAMAGTAIVAGHSSHSNKPVSANNRNGNSGNNDGGTNDKTDSTNGSGVEKAVATAPRQKNQPHLPEIAVAGTGLGTVSGNDSLLNQLARSKSPAPNKSLHLNRSLNFGLAFGPDYTDGGGITNNQIGNTIGLTMGYYLTDKLSVNTGIFYSNKFYWAHGRNYNHPRPGQYASTYASPPPIDYVNGSCNMWELPFTLRYDFAHNEKTRFFANAGLSSYFMMKQSYIYFVHTSQQRMAAWKTSNNQQVNYWFSVADIALGFETEVGKGVSFQAEPFVKLPLRSMGVENLRLNSYGFLLSFRYTPVLNRSRK